MTERSIPEVHIHIHEAPDTASIEQGLASLMASTDALAAKVNELGSALTAHMERDRATEEALAAVTQAYNDLLADDAVENSALESIGEAVDQLTAAVSQEVPEVDPDPESPPADSETPPESSETPSEGSESSETSNP